MHLKSFKLIAENLSCVVKSTTCKVSKHGRRRHRRVIKRQNDLDISLPLGQV